MTDTCTLCELPLDAQPVTATDVQGSFCCRGCLSVWRAIDDIDTVPTDTFSKQIDSETEQDDDEISDGSETRELSEVFLSVDGMHCTTCESFISLRGQRTAGIESVEANYATDTACVRFDPEQVDEKNLQELLSGYGYDAHLRNDSATGDVRRNEAAFQRLILGGFLAMLIMPWYVFFLYPSYVGIETGILSADMTTPVGLYLPMAIVGLLAGGVVFYTGWPILRGAYVSLRTGQPNMDLLLAIAVLSAYAYSTIALAIGSIHLYYDVAVAIVLVVTAGTYYEDRLKQEATGLLSELTSMRVSEATLRNDDGTVTVVPVESLVAGDEIIVRPGDRVPVDGTVIEGVAAVDEAVLTGEARPVTKHPSDEVVGGSLVTDSPLVITVGQDAENSLDRLTSLLWSVQTQHPSVQRFADKLATVFVPLVLVVGATVGGSRILAGEPVATAFLAALTVLIVACPCAMGLATPLAIASGLRDALRNGIVVTNSALFETAPAVDTLVLDKTGTLTTGEMTVLSVDGDPSAITAAAAVEQRSNHPVATAIVNYAGLSTDGGSPPPKRAGSGAGKHSEPSLQFGDSATVTDYKRHPGEGVSAEVDGTSVVVGTDALVERCAGTLPASLRSSVEAARQSGAVPVVVGIGGEARAVAAVGDREREEWQQVVSAFDEEQVVVLTGDDESAAASFREHPAVDDVFAGVPPDGKVATLRALSADGTTVMVGDGTNDVPALGVADIGVAFSGTASAADAADVVLVDGSLADLPIALDLASATRRRIHENVAWAFCYNAVAIPLAAAGLLNPLLAAVAMAGSSILVVLNSRRELL